MLSRLKRALGFVWECGSGWTISSLILLITQGFLPLITLYLMKLVVDSVTAGFASADKSSAFNLVITYIVLVAIVALITAILRQIANVVTETLALKVTDFMQHVIHEKSEKVDLEYFENADYYDSLHRAQIEAPSRPTSILQGITRVSQSTISLIGIIGLLFAFNWLLTLVLIIAAIPGVLVKAKYAKKLFKLQWIWTPAERKAQYYSFMLTDFSHVKEHRLFNLGKIFIERYRLLRKDLRREHVAYVVRNSGAQVLTEIGAIIFIFTALSFVARQAVFGIITIGDMVMFFGAFQQGLAFLRQTFNGLAGLYEDDLFLQNLFRFLDLKQKVVEPGLPKPVPSKTVHGIEFENVSFKYPNGSRPVLHNISLNIPPGKVVAVVGENGAGKTTLVKLLCRFYDPDEGRIALEKIDLREYNSGQWRKKISVIFQDFVKFQLTARENIWFGNVESSAEIEKIRNAARLAGADKVIESLPKGYENILGKWFAEGEELSIGEWQKIALARAFMRDSQIVVLDEPTSAMDAKSEFEVFQHFRNLIENQSALIISHRFSTVKMADEIFVMDEGTIVEQGSHDELVKLNGKYAKLYEMQARHYR